MRASEVIYSSCLDLLTPNLTNRDDGMPCATTYAAIHSLHCT